LRTQSLVASVWMTAGSKLGLAAKSNSRRDFCLAAAGYIWAFAALRPSPGARAHYDRRKAADDAHTAALRHLFNRLIGCLYHCLKMRRTYEGWELNT
jgi:hypothetical protein